MKKVLLIGGAGFIGMRITKYLCENREDYSITIADNFFRGKMDDDLTSLVEKHGIRVVSDDFTKAEAFNALDKDYDYVYMLASVVGVKYTEEIPNELIRINSFLILNTLEWIKHTDCKKVLFSSTSECYAGTIESFGYEIPTPEEVPLTIQDIQHPRFTYAVTKMLGESGFFNYSKVFGFECVVVRYHNVYGERMGFKHVIPQVTQRFLDGENPFKVYGYDQTRAFNYVDDAVRGTVMAMEAEKSNGEIYHIGDSRAEIKIEELVRYIGELMEYHGEYDMQAAPSGSVSRRCPNVSKAENELGYVPEIEWKEGVKRTVEWYRNYIEAGKLVFE